ncbi:MAG TPA: (4Fe-4S)-binding protein [Anaerovoracaceae bacterium]|nr:(4Fe-4S)-binding protein [Anaerovoracaceae bacterium]
MKEENQYREYSTDDLIVYWNFAECSHSGKCTALLPSVFSPDKRPWVCLEGADPLDIIKTIDKCPTGALRYQLTENSKIDPELAKGPGWIGYKADPAVVQIRMVHNGPLLVKGPVRMVDHNGNTIKECDSLVLCRCGKTANPPFCDGSHR